MFSWLKKKLGAEKARPQAFGLGGHGLLLSVSVDCLVRVEPEGTALVQSHATGASLRVIPGTEPATSPPSQQGDGWSTGVGGPRLVVDGGGPFSDLVLRVDVGLGASPWNLLLGGAWLSPPPGFTLFTHDGRLATTELHLGLRPQDGAFFNFGVESGVPDQQRLTTSALETRVGHGTAPVRWDEVAYAHAGNPWRRRIYLAPWPEGTLVVRAQAPEVLARVMWHGVEHVLASIEPT